MREVMRGGGRRGFFEVHEHYAAEHPGGLRAVSTASTVGIVAKQPASWPARWTTTHRIKGARFVRFCDSFNIPIVTFEDVPGFMPGVVQELGGIIRTAPSCSTPTAEATVPKLTSSRARPTAAPTA
jgi:propionyl-CoA carboxylase beta chain